MDGSTTVVPPQRDPQAQANLRHTRLAVQYGHSPQQRNPTHACRSSPATQGLPVKAAGCACWAAQMACLQPRYSPRPALWGTQTAGEFQNMSGMRRNLAAAARARSWTGAGQWAHCHPAARGVAPTSLLLQSIKPDIRPVKPAVQSGGFGSARRHGIVTKGLGLQEPYQQSHPRLHHVGCLHQATVVRPSQLGAHHNLLRTAHTECRQTPSSDRARRGRQCLRPARERWQV